MSSIVDPQATFLKRAPRRRFFFRQFRKFGCQGTTMARFYQPSQSPHSHHSRPHRHHLVPCCSSKGSPLRRSAERVEKRRSRRIMAHDPSHPGRGLLARLHSGSRCTQPKAVTNSASSPLLMCWLPCCFLIYKCALSPAEPSSCGFPQPEPESEWT